MEGKQNVNCLHPGICRLGVTIPAGAASDPWRNMPCEPGPSGPCNSARSSRSWSRSPCTAAAQWHKRSPFCCHAPCRKLHMPCPPPPSHLSPVHHMHCDGSRWSPCPSRFMHRIEASTVDKMPYQKQLTSGVTDKTTNPDEGGGDSHDIRTLGLGWNWQAGYTCLCGIPRHQ
jgi:hypothetical protein